MDTNTTTINGKPVPSPAKEVMEDLAAERDEVAEAAEDYAAELFDALDGLPPSDRVERARALLAASTHALDALVKRDNRPPCPVIPLRLATVAPKVPDPPAKGKPNRGPAAKRQPDPDTVSDSGSGSNGEARAAERLRAIAERAPEPAPPGPGRGKKKDRAPSAPGFHKQDGSRSEKQLRAIAERAPEPAPPGPGRGKKKDPAPSADSFSRPGARSEEQLRAIAERAPEPARELFRG